MPSRSFTAWKSGRDLTCTRCPFPAAGRASSQRFDVALLPVIDYQRMAGLRLLTAAGSGATAPRSPSASSAPTDRADPHAGMRHRQPHLRRPGPRDPRRAFGFTPRIRRRCDRGRHSRSAGRARLLIGDKVVCEEPRGLPYQLDLGEAWKELTGLPFVFAAWMARAGVDLGDLPSAWSEAKQRRPCARRRDHRQHAVPRGWPRESPAAT